MGPCEQTLLITPSTGLVFDIQRFCLHDGPGIRTTVFFKGCPLQCAWCQNPESQKVTAELAYYRERCIRCRDCLRVCPENAILAEDEKWIDREKCTLCGRCVDTCTSRGIELVGRNWNAEDLLGEVLKDQDFFSESGGGITLSGGEPMLQHAFLIEWLPRVKAHGIHVTMETCGLAEWPRIQRVAPFVDLFYFDLKVMNPEKHHHYTGVDNRIILENFMKLSANAKNLQARMPLVPGITSTPENISETSGFLKSAGHSIIHCLPYHKMGESKRIRLGAGEVSIDAASPTPEELDVAIAVFQKEGIDAVVYD